MSRFRTQTTTKTENLAGGEAFKETDKFELVSLLLTSFVNDKFYESANTQLVRLTELVHRIDDKKFIAKAAIYARKEFGMRSITHALIAELAKEVKGKSWLKFGIRRTIHRPDDMLEILGYYISKYNKPIPNSLKKGLTLGLKHFDSYQLAKYRGEKSGLKLVDMFNLIHPKPTAENKELYNNIMTGKLKSTGTWESKLTQTGHEVKDIVDDDEKIEKQKELKKQVWKELIINRKIGYFALLRNLRNIIEQGDNETIDVACKMLTDKNLITKSLVLPFRFSTALKEVEKLSSSNIRQVVNAIHDALELSLSNVPKLDGKTLVVLDESGSMMGKPMQIGSLFAAVLYKTNDADLMTFSDEARFRNIHSRDSVLSIAGKLQYDSVGSSTDFRTIFEKASEKYDRIIILSDMQGWVGYNNPSKSYNEYKIKTKAKPHMYSFDLCGHGTLQFPEKQVYCIAGFSDKVFDIMKMLEQDRNALIEKIDEIEL